MNNNYLAERAEDDQAQFRNTLSDLAQKTEGIRSIINHNSSDGYAFTPITELSQDILSCERLLMSAREFYFAYNNDKALFQTELSDDIKEKIKNAAKITFNNMYFRSADILPLSTNSAPSITYTNLSSRTELKNIYLLIRVRYGLSEYCYPPIALADMITEFGQDADILESNREAYIAALLSSPPTGDYQIVSISLAEITEDSAEYEYVNITAVDKWVAVNSDKALAISIDVDNQKITEWSVGDSVRITNSLGKSFETKILSIDQPTQTVIFTEETPFHNLYSSATINLYVEREGSWPFTLIVPISSPLKKAIDGEQKKDKIIQKANGHWIIERNVTEDFHDKTTTEEVLPLNIEASLDLLLKDISTSTVYSINSTTAEIVKSDKSLSILGNTRTVGANHFGVGDPRDGEMCSIAKMNGAITKFNFINENTIYTI